MLGVLVGVRILRTMKNMMERQMGHEMEAGLQGKPYGSFPKLGVPFWGSP